MATNLANGAQNPACNGNFHCCSIVGEIELQIYFRMLFAFIFFAWKAKFGQIDHCYNIK